MYLELKHLQTLQTLRDTGSLMAAAERLHLTQSALSHQIKGLERYFNATLFVRKSNPLVFTPAGERLLQLADRIMPSVIHAENELCRLGAGVAGRINIAIECHSCFDWLLPTMDAYRKKHPDVELDLTLGVSFEAMPALQHGLVDLVITSDPQPLPRIHFESLFRYEALLAVRNSHPLAAQGWIRPEDLRSETLITYPVEKERLDIYTRFLLPAGVAPAMVRTAELTAIMLQLVASGRGVCALPNWALHEYLQRQYVAAVRIGREGLHGTLHAAVRDTELRKTYMQDFLAMAKQISFENLSGIDRP